MLAVAFLPHPPALLPGLTGGTVRELVELRAAVRDTVAGVLAPGPERVVVVGPADTGGVRGLRGIGGPAREMPDGALSVALADVLLDAAGWTGPRRRVVLDPWAGEPILPSLAGPTGAGTVLLVMGDGSARRHPDAPGGPHPGAVGFDDTVAAAMAAGDPVALGALDPDLGVAVQAAGAVVWRAVGRSLATRRIDVAGLRHYGAPFGVAYFVAEWRAAS